MTYNPYNLYPSTRGFSAVSAFGGIITVKDLQAFHSTLQYGLEPLYWESIIVGAAGVTHLPNESAARLRNTAANGDKITRQTYQYFSYQPGNGHKLEATGVIGAAKANVRQRIGLFDNSNGAFFEMVSTGIGVCVRTFAGGSASDTRVAQASWNLDKLDGTGFSGVTLDFSKTQIFVISLQWLGVGTVKFGFVVDGVLRYCHAVHNANALTTVYMTTAQLPVRYELENTAGTASQTDMLQVCAAVKIEGGGVETPATFAVSNGATLRAVGATEVPVLSIRPSTVFPAGGSITMRKSIALLSLDVFSEDAPVYWRLVYNPTWTAASWVSFDTTNSGAQYDISATSVTGGVQIAAGFVATGSRGGTSEQAFGSELIGTLDYAGTLQRGFALCCTRIGAVSSDVSVAIQWKEI